MSGTATARRRPLALTPARLAALTAALLVAVAVTGGYAFDWAWSGFGRHRELWDLLHLLVLPVALAGLPLWYRTRQRFTRVWRAGGASAFGLFVLAVFGGYRLGWGWTGFQGNHLWDWLELLVLPVAVTLLPLWLDERPRLPGRIMVAMMAFAVAFGVVVLGGYVLDWAWTGFRGNTAWDWTQLLLVPFGLPAGVAWLAREERQRPVDVDGQPSPRGSLSQR